VDELGKEKERFLLQFGKKKKGGSSFLEKGRGVQRKRGSPHSLQKRKGRIAPPNLLGGGS